ncbi:MAG: hypothetical protein JWM14_1866 [Chitinophagaceae bacterium]|nr:hypothetical protein [Chitinophagaceae bacterium]
MMILRALSLLFLVAVFSFALSNQELLVRHIESLHISADVSEVIFNTDDSVIQRNNDKPTFMQVEKINQHELPTQARIGYLLSRGF